MAVRRCTIKPLTESIGESSKIDRETGVIRNVKILGRVSRNGREYSTGALLEAAEKYEGMRVNLDHPDRSNPKVARSVTSQWGTLRSVRATDDGVFGDLEYLKSHAQTEPLLEMAERWPNQFGLSHNADCVGVRSGGKTIIESVEHVRSVDVVQRPATTEGLFESEGDYVKKKFKALLESLPETTKGRKGLLRFLEEDMMGGMLAETPVEVAPEAKPEDQIWEGFRSAVLAVLDDSSMDITTTLAKIQEILTAYDTSFSSSGSNSTATETPSTEQTSTTESVDELRREIRALRSENKARAVLEEHDIQATSGRIRGIVSVLESESDLQDLIESLPKRSAARTSEDTSRRKPQRSAPVMESEGEKFGTALPTKDYKEFAQFVR